VGAGGSPSFIEAAYTLGAPIPAGDWTIVGDGILAGSGVQSVTVRFEVRLRPKDQSGDGADSVLVAATNTFNRDTTKPFAAVPFKATLPGIAGPAEAGDRLVLRVTATGGDPGGVYILNGEGRNSGGNIPRIDLPFLAK
jgi:hypothetical protein